MLMDAKEAREREEAARREREAREAAGTSALVVPEAADLDANRQGFQAFALDGGDVELLVAETLDGRLALADSYVGVKGGDKGPAGMRYMRPELDGEVPSEPLLFQVKKVYFIGMTPNDEGTDVIFDLDNVFLFDGGKKILSRSEVRMVGTPPLVEPVLRIRPSGITVEEGFLLPDPIQVSMDAAANVPEMSEEEMAEKLAELEKAAEELDELDEAPDVPGVDMM
ncbi:hypothetical protein GPECTOR_88g453 [Gonium pectorale]|uniref:Uncharacterized protein n=1 Tax=Gonium pectorale TaxID=33097 RepID=A0A150G2H0_GONPE|nr:hypothetical protein GPECTOR_88g453 [Gonium pectorale]|eukprot:KXZ43510.1 hypothetical protein GPECTOR_88g453 [Gonium pectorale]